MKIQLETFPDKMNRSFRMMFNPRLSDLFFWHFHPEYELVYIKAAQGTRHVGSHNSVFQGSDLVLIGSNIPHLNFDYGIKTPYKKVVVHLKKEFVEKHFIHIPELAVINRMFEKSKHGLAFKGPLIDRVGEKLFNLENLEPFRQYLQLLEVLQSIAECSDFELLHEQAFPIAFSDREQTRIQTIYAFVDKNYHRKIELKEVAAISNMAKEAFCRYFKKTTKYTFIEFLNRYRISQSKRLLMSGKTVGESCFSSGFESLSYYNRIFKKITGETPSVFRKRYI